MRIAIDARFYGEAGPGRYCAELLRNLEQIDRNNEYTVFLKSSNYGSYKPSDPRFKKVLADFHWYSFAEQLIFPIILYRGNFDLVHFAQINTPILYLRPFVVTIHDLILHEFSMERGSLLNRLFYRFKKMPYRLVFLKDVLLSHYIIVPSQATKDDILKYYNVQPDKIVVTHEAVDHYPSGRAEPESEVLRKCGINKPYILCLGSFYPHKNIHRLVEAFKILRNKKIFNGQLILVGKESYFSLLIRSFVERESVPGVIFPGAKHPQGYLSDQEVETIFAGAYVYVQPALKEGFGIPPVEAMVFGVPVAVSNIPCLREMCSEAAIYFDPGNAADMAAKLGMLVEDQGLRRSLVEKGYENIKRFSWKKLAEETKLVYDKSFRQYVND